MADAINGVLCNENAAELCEVNTDYIQTCKDSAAASIWNGSGIVQTSQRAENFAQGCDFSQNVKFWKPPNWTDASTYDCAVEDEVGCNCEGIDMGRETLFKLADVKCWGMNDCEQVCLGNSAASPLDVIQNQLVGPYFVNQLVGKLLGSAVAVQQAIIADGAASDYAGLILDECSDAPKPVDECTFIDANCMTDCGEWDGVLMHKDMVMNALKRRYIECYCEFDGGPNAYRTTDGMRVVVVPKSWGDVYLKDADGCYISIYFKNGAFEYGEGSIATPFERYRDPKANNCSGAESIYYRRLYTLRPRGTVFTHAQVGDEMFAPNSSLFDPANWGITIPAENFGLGFSLNAIA